MMIIYTKKGVGILVDDSDYEELNQYSWCISTQGYPSRGLRMKKENITVLMHRTVMKAKKGQYVDHISHNKLDNRKGNLRICTNQQNGMNQKKRTDNTSGVTGISWNKQKNGWDSYIALNSKKKHLGRFKNIEDAIKIRKEAEIQYFGEFRYKSV